MDSPELICERTDDLYLVLSVVHEPEIWDSISEDGRSIDDYSPDIVKDCWLILHNGLQLVGAYLLKAENCCTCEIHAHVLPEMRGKYAKESAIAVLQWILDDCPTQYVKFNAEIPVIYPNVIHFTKNAGFQEEGINRQSYRKHGLLHDQVRLGITRQEIKAFLNERN